MEQNSNWQLSSCLFFWNPKLKIISVSPPQVFFLVTWFLILYCKGPLSFFTRHLTPAKWVGMEWFLQVIGAVCRKMAIEAFVYWFYMFINGIFQIMFWSSYPKSCLPLELFCCCFNQIVEDLRTSAHVQRKTWFWGILII